jgi:hypothetical protein
MTELESKQHVRFIANNLGITVQDIPRSNDVDDNRPDFEFLCGDECSLVELKRREGAWNLTNDEGRMLDAGGIVDRSESLGPHNTISARIEEAHLQLSAFQSTRHAFRLVWYCTYGQFSDLAAQRVRATLLGDITVFESDSERQWRAYFFDYNKFYQFREVLDGAIVSNVGSAQVSAQLILNPLSSRYDRFRSSRLVRAFSSGLLDPMTEREEDAVIVGSGADRTSEQSKLDYLASAYGIHHPFIIRMGHFAVMCLPNPISKNAEPS